MPDTFDDNAPGSEVREKLNDLLTRYGPSADANPFTTAEQAQLAELYDVKQFGEYIPSFNLKSEAQAAEIPNVHNFIQAAGTLYVYDATGTDLVTTSGTGTNDTWSFFEYTDGAFIIKDNADGTKRLKFQASGIPTGTTVTLTSPSESGTLLTEADLVGVATDVLNEGELSPVPVEASFTPALTFETPGTLAITYDVQDGWYQRVGDKITGHVYLKIPTLTKGTAAGEARIDLSDIGITPSGYSGYGNFIRKSTHLNVPDTAGEAPLLLYGDIASGQTYMTLHYESPSFGRQDVVVGDFDGGTTAGSLFIKIEFGFRA